MTGWEYRYRIVAFDADGELIEVHDAPGGELNLDLDGLSGPGDRRARFLRIREYVLKPGGPGSAGTGRLPEAPCPRCGSDRPLGSSGVCTGCAAELGWDPQCPACLADQAGQPTDDLVHLGTCNPNRF